MKSRTENTGIEISLSNEEVLVLFDWIARFNENENTFQDQSEEKVLFDLESILEERISETLASAGLAGGVTSKLSGGEFWDGARNGLISASLNHVAHGIRQRIEQQKELKPIDFKESSDKEKIGQVLKGIRQARLNGDASLDIGKLFKNLPTWGEGHNKIISEMNLNGENITVQMNLGTPRGGLNIELFPSYGQVNLGDKGVYMNGFSKTGYWNSLEFSRYNGNLRILRLMTPNTDFYNLEKHIGTR